MVELNYQLGMQKGHVQKIGSSYFFYCKSRWKYDHAVAEYSIRNQQT